MYITIIYALIWDVKADLTTGQEIVAALPWQIRKALGARGPTNKP